MSEKNGGYGRRQNFDELYDFVKKTLEQRGMKTSLRALDYACEKHAGQRRKGSGLPYAVHPLWMARYLLLQNDPAVTDVTVAASLLHDVPEENPEIGVDRLPFELEVREVVGHLTIIKRATEPTFDRRVRSADEMSQTKDSAIIRAVDMLDILHTIPQDFAPDRIRKIVLENHMLKNPKLVEAGERWSDELGYLMAKLVEEIQGLNYAYAVIYKVRLENDPNFINAPDAEDYSYLLY